MSCVCIGEEKDRFFETLDLRLHLVRQDARLELREVVDGSLAMGGSDHVCRVLPDVPRDFPPGGLDGGYGVGQCSILENHEND